MWCPEHANVLSLLGQLKRLFGGGLESHHFLCGNHQGPSHFHADFVWTKRYVVVYVLDKSQQPGQTEEETVAVADASKEESTHCSETLRSA